jgi:inorganic pyrophosphatase
LPIAARREADLASVMALPRRLRDELEHFFIAATALEGKDAAILGWGGPEEALKLLSSSPA